MKISSVLALASLILYLNLFIMYFNNDTLTVMQFIKMHAIKYIFSLLCSLFAKAALIIENNKT